MRSLPALLFSTLALGGCFSGPIAPESSGSEEALATRPPTPVGWTVVESVARDSRIALPEWMVAFDTATAVFANEPAPGIPGFIELMAEGPAAAEVQPAAGTSLDQWARERFSTSLSVLPAPTQRTLPSGQALVYSAITDAGTVGARQYALYAISTDEGVGFLLIDGSPARWQLRRADIEQITLSLELGRAP